MRNCELTESWIEREGFAALPAKDFLRAPEHVRNTMGVYMILISGAADLLSRTGLPVIADLTDWAVSGRQHVYTGESVAMRSRALLHLRGTVRDSAVREILLALQLSSGVLWSQRSETLEDLEAKLSEWLSENAMVAFRVCDYVRDVERDLIRRMPSPFNTKDNQKTGFTPALKATRAQFRNHLKATGQVRHRERRPRAAWLTDRTVDHLAGEPAQVT